MRLVIGYLEKDEFVTAAPNWSKLGDVLDELDARGVRWGIVCGCCTAVCAAGLAAAVAAGFGLL